MKITSIQPLHITDWRHTVGVLAILLAAFTCSFNVVAATVLEIGLGDMLHHSELVFEGRVTRVESSHEQTSKARAFGRT